MSCSDVSYYFSWLESPNHKRALPRELGCKLITSDAAIFSAAGSFNSSLINHPGPVFEATQIVDILVTHIFEQLASEG